MDDLNELLIAPYVQHNASLHRLESASRRLSKPWRRQLLQAESVACQLGLTLRAGSNIDIWWAGHLPPLFRSSLLGQIKLARIALGAHDRAWAWRTRTPYFPISQISALMRNSILDGERVPPPVLQRHIHQIQKVLKNTQPQTIVVTANYDPGLRLLAFAAREMGLPVALYPHGLSSPRFYLSLNDRLCSHFLCWTAEEMLEYIDLGVAPNHCHVVGPLRDFPQSQAQDYGTREVRQRNVDVPDVDILLLGQRIRPPGFVDFVQRIAQESASCGLTFGYRAHPLEDASDLEAMLDPDDLLVPEVPIASHLARARIIVGGASTAMIEASLLGRYTVFVEDLALPSQLGSLTTYLKRISSAVTTTRSLSVDHLITNLNVPTNAAPSPDVNPSKELPELIRSGWFRN